MPLPLPLPLRHSQRAALVLYLATLAVLIPVVRLALRAPFATDELTYAHGAWAIAHGQQPFRDFFFHHFPLVLQLGSLVFHFTDDPSGIVALRWLMVPIWLGALALAAGLNARHSLWSALLTAPLIASLYKWLTYGTQFRPDPLALALFLASLSLVTRSGSRARASAFAAGVLYVLAVWASQKVLIYGVAVPLAWLTSVVLARSGSAQPRLVQHPTMLAAGVVAGSAPIAAYLTWAGSWGDLVTWCWHWGLMHEKYYPARPLMSSLRGTVDRDAYVVLLGVLGLVWTLVRLLRQPVRAWLADRDLLLVVSAFTTALSYAMQNAPYAWSLVAPLTFVGLFAARVLGEVVELASRRANSAWLPMGTLGAAAFVGLAGVPTSPWTPPAHTGSRRQQDTMLAAVAKLTATTDPVYDNTGAYVARPHASFYYFTDRTARIVLAKTLIREIPAALRARGVTVDIADYRETELPRPLRTFIEAHYLPVLRDIRLWGQRFKGLRPGARARFEAVRADEYYVVPAKVIATRGLSLDGQPLARQVFELARGKHELTWTAPGKAPDFAVLWLPADGKLRAPLANQSTAASEP